MFLGDGGGAAALAPRARERFAVAFLYCYGCLPLLARGVPLVPSPCGICALASPPTELLCPHSQGRWSPASSSSPVLLPRRLGAGFHLSRPSPLIWTGVHGSFSQFLASLGSFSFPVAAFLERYSNSARIFLFPVAACFDLFVLSWSLTLSGIVELEGLRLSLLRRRCRAQLLSQLRLPSATCCKGGTMPPLQVNIL